MHLAYQVGLLNPVLRIALSLFRDGDLTKDFHSGWPPARYSTKMAVTMTPSAAEATNQRRRTIHVQICERRILMTAHINRLEIHAIFFTYIILSMRKSDHYDCIKETVSLSHEV